MTARPPYRPGQRPSQAQAHCTAQMALETQLLAWLRSKGSRIAEWDYLITDRLTPGYLVCSSTLDSGWLVVRYVPIVVTVTNPWRRVWGPQRDRTHDAVLTQALTAAHRLLMAEGWNVRLRCDPICAEYYCPCLTVEHGPGGGDA